MANAATGMARATRSSFLRRLVNNIKQDLSWLIAPLWTWTGVLLLSPSVYLLGVTAMYGKNHILAVVFYFIGLGYFLAKSLSQARTEERKAFKSFALILIFAAFLAASLYWDWYIFRTDTQAPYIISGITDWLWLRLLSLWALPKRWIVVAFVAGVLVTEVLRLLRERQRQGEQEGAGNNRQGTDSQTLEISDSFHGCKDPGLHKKLETDAATIKDLVWVVSIFYWPEFDKSQPRIEFIFNVFNISLFDVVINMNGGYVLFGDDNEQFHLEPKFIAQKQGLCRSRDTTNFVVRQAVTTDEIAKRFKGSDDTRISFGNLRIHFSGTEESPEILTTPLDVNHYLFTAKRAWHNPNRPKFLPEQSTLTSQSETDESTNTTPNIVYVGSNLVSVHSDDKGKIVRTKNVPRAPSWRLAHPTYYLILATYRNEPIEGHKPIHAERVSARLTYTLPDEPLIVSRAQWFPENAFTNNFAYNDERSFVIAVLSRQANSIGALQNGEFVDLESDEVELSIQLIFETNGVIKDAGKFELIRTPEPNLNIRVLPLDEKGVAANKKGDGSR